jgi:hypothetical protein
MPISANPDATAPYWLAADEGIPEETRPTFVCRFMTRREHQRVADLAKQAFETKDDAACYDLLIQALSVGVVGWRNIKGRDGADVPFDLSSIDAVLTNAEIWEAVYGYPRAVSRTENDRFLSRSRSQPIGAPSATAAPTAASTNPPPAVPSGFVAADAPGTAVTTATAAVA